MTASFAIKGEVADPEAKSFAFSEQKTMYGGKSISRGDRIFVFASENVWFGSKSMYDEAGFKEVARRKPRRPIVRIKTA
jgi:hypothetical protein